LAEQIGTIAFKKKYGPPKPARHMWA